MPIDLYRAIARDQIKSGCEPNDAGCWIWKRTHQTNGYGQTRFLGKQIGAHRASYQAFIGDIPEGMEVCHTCDVRNCVNPAHLFLATHSENMLDQKRKGRTNNGVLAGAFVPKHDPKTGRFLKLKGD